MKLSALSLFAVLGTATSMASVIQGPVTSPVDGNQYVLLSSSTWTSAETTAEQMGGHLASIHGKAQSDWIAQTFGTVSRYLWIGLYDPTKDAGGGSHASNFVWVDGSAVDYTNWSNGEPNNWPAGNGEYWTELSLIPPPGSTVDYGKWNDLPNQTTTIYGPNTYGPNFGLVELPEPTVGLLLAAAPIALRRKRSCC